MNDVRVLILAHGHPDFSLGGGEISAHEQWMELRRRGVNAMLLARVDQSMSHTGAPFLARRPDGSELLFSIPPVNHFRHSQPHFSTICEAFYNLLDSFRPTAVHFHHYVHLGLELVRAIRNCRPDASIVMTLHEYLAICHAQGQMLKTNGFLCQKAAPLDCNRCFPDISAQDFFMRESFIKSFFELVDTFVCPSAFLRDRYVAWGLPVEKTVVLENGRPSVPRQNVLTTKDDGVENRFLVLGQLSRLKGTLVLLEALRLLPNHVRSRIAVEIHGSVQHADENFKSALFDSLKALEGSVRLCGAYLPEHVNGIIRRHGWVIVPSIWWENSPVVIQEAFAAGRPVICSNIGGMAEKVKDGTDGFHFQVSNSHDLAARIEACVGRRQLWETMSANVRQPPSVESTVDCLLQIYGNRDAPVSRSQASLA